MDDFISREAAIKEIKAHVCFACPFKAYSCTPEKCGTNAALKAISEIPAADVVEVVRCKDCKLMSHDEHGYWCINDYQACLAPEKDYCSRAVRRADNG